MRKYNNKTKKMIGIVLGLFLIIVVIFSLFLKKAIDIEKIEYKVLASSVLFDKEKNIITTTLDGIIKVKWGGDYYLKYNEKNYNLGDHAVVYNTNSGDISLYGTYYEVTRDNKVNVIENENVVESSVNSRFFKLADRKYLIIDRTIESEDAKFVASNYLIVELDKLGNATLLNDKVSVKTITPTVLKTSSYSFDIANEKLNFGTEDIDLKEIIGSTNLYDESTYDLNAKNDEDDEGTGTGNGNGTGSGNGTGDGTGTGEGGTSDGTGSGDGSGSGGGGGGGGGGSGSGTGNGNGTGDGIGTGIGTGDGNGVGTGGTGAGVGTGSGSGVASGTTQGSNSGYNNNYSGNVSDNAVSQIIKATTTTSVIRITPLIASISVDYVIYDPDSEYTSVYVEVENANTGNINTVYLSKSETNVSINNLDPSTAYNLQFKYNTASSSGVVFDKVDTVSTVLPSMNLSVTKVTSSILSYVISFDNNYTIMSGQVQIYINGKVVQPIKDNISTSGYVNKISRTVDISDFDVSKGDIVVVKLTSLGFNTYNTVTNTEDGLVSYSFRY